MADITNLSNFLGDVADAIRTKNGTTDTIPASEFDTKILEIETGIDTSDATATSNDIVAGKTAYVDGSKVTGVVPVREVVDIDAEGIQEDDVNVVTISTVTEQMMIHKNSTIQTNTDKALLAEAIGLTSNKIIAGETVLGIEGTAESSSGGVKLFKTVEEMNNSADNNEGDLAIVYNESTNKNSTSEDKLTFIYFPETVTLSSAITTETGLSYISGEKTITGTLNKNSLELLLPDFKLYYTSVDGITYTKCNENIKYVLLEDEYSWNTANTWLDVYGQFIQIGNMNFMGLYEYKRKFNEDLVTLPSITTDVQLQSGNMGFPYTYEYNYNKTDLLEVLSKIKTALGEDTADMGIFRAGGKLYVGTSVHTSSSGTSYDSLNPVVTNYTDDTTKYVSLVPGKLMTDAVYGVSGSISLKLYEINLDDKTYTTSNAYSYTNIDNGSWLEVTVPDLETYPIRYVGADNTLIFDYAGRYHNEPGGTSRYFSCKVVNPDIIGMELVYDYADTQLTVKQAAHIVNGLVGYGGNGIINGTASIDPNTMAKWYKSVDEMNADTSVDAGTLAIIYNDDYKGLAAYDKMTQIYLPETIVSETKIYANSTDSRNTTACALMGEDGYTMDYFIYPSEAGFCTESYEFLAYYHSSDGITYTADTANSVVHSKGLTEEYIDLGFSWDAETKILTFPTETTLNPDENGPLFSFDPEYNEESAKLFKKPNYDFLGIYQFNGTTWEPAKNQLTVTVSDIIENKVAYGQTGVITGDGSIYDNIDIRRLFERFHGANNVFEDNGDLYASYGMYNAAKLYTNLKDGEFIKGIKCTPYTGTTSNAVAMMPYVSPAALSSDGTKSLKVDKTNDKIYVLDVTTGATLLEYDIAFLRPSYYTSEDGTGKNYKLVLISNDECIIFTYTEKVGRFYKIGLTEHNIQQLDLTFASTNASTLYGVDSLYGYDKKNNRLYYGGEIETTNDSKYQMILGYIDTNTFTNNYVINESVSAYNLYMYVGLTTNRELICSISKMTSSGASSTYQARRYGEDLTLINSSTSAGGTISGSNCYPLHNSVMYDDGTYLYWGMSYRMPKSTLVRESYSTDYKLKPRYLDFDFKYGSDSNYGIINFETGETLITYKSFSTGYWYPSSIASSLTIYPTAISDKNGDLVLMTQDCRARLNIFDIEICEPSVADYVLTLAEIQYTYSSRTGITTIESGDQYIYMPKAINQYASTITPEEYNTALDAAVEILGEEVE